MNDAIFTAMGKVQEKLQKLYKTPEPPCSKVQKDLAKTQVLLMEFMQLVISQRSTERNNIIGNKLKELLDKSRRKYYKIRCNEDIDEHLKSTKEIKENKGRIEYAYTVALKKDTPILVRSECLADLPDGYHLNQDEVYGGRIACCKWRISRVHFPHGEVSPWNQPKRLN